MKQQLENIAKEINNVVNKKIRKSSIDISHELDSIIERIKDIVNVNTLTDLELRFSNYLIDKCNQFKITVEIKEFKF